MAAGQEGSEIASQHLKFGAARSRSEVPTRTMKRPDECAAAPRLSTRRAPRAPRKEGLQLPAAVVIYYS